MFNSKLYLRDELVFQKQSIPYVVFRKLQNTKQLEKWYVYVHVYTCVHVPTFCTFYVQASMKNMNT